MKTTTFAALVLVSFLFAGCEPSLGDNDSYLLKKEAEQGDRPKGCIGTHCGAADPDDFDGPKGMNGIADPSGSPGIDWDGELPVYEDFSKVDEDSNAETDEPVAAEEVAPSPTPSYVGQSMLMTYEGNLNAEYLVYNGYCEGEFFNVLDFEWNISQHQQFGLGIMHPEYYSKCSLEIYLLDSEGNETEADGNLSITYEMFGAPTEEMEPITVCRQEDGKYVWNPNDPAASCAGN